MTGRTEKQIIESWKHRESTSLVSIIYTTYNQEQYVIDAIEGFIIQKTDFPIEIIIH
ncbi:MAG: Glycosyltransferase, partial [uncultured bacterium]